jgi:hypothetical protein
VPEVGGPVAVAPARPFWLILWHELFVPARPAWTTLACIWLLLFALNTVNRPSATEGSLPASSLTDTRPPLLLWREREMAFAALLSPPPAPAPAPPSGTPTSFCPPGRRSDKSPLALIS